MTKLEEVARAIKASFSAQDLMEGRIDFLPMARSAVEALREPTPEMQAAMMKAFIDTASAVQTHYAMIDAILNESP